MTGGWGRKIAAGVSGAAVLGTAFGGAIAQDGGGFVLDGSVRFGLEVDDNGPLAVDSPGTDTTLSTDLAFGLTSETPGSNLSLSFGASLVNEDLADRTGRSGLVDPFLGVDYELEGPDSLVRFGAEYSSEDLTNRTVDQFGTDFIEDDLVVSGGDLESIEADIELSFGEDAPLGASLAYTYSDRIYSNDADPSLFDRTTETLRLTGFAQVSETARLRAFASRSDYRAEDLTSTERISDSLGVGVELSINPVLTFDGEVSADFVEETNIISGLPVVEETDGIGFDATLTQELPNGVISLVANREIRTAGSRSELRVVREMDLPTGTLGFSLGVSASGGGDTILVGDVNWSHQLPRGVLSVNASREATFNDDDELRTRTFAGLTYEHEINAVSSFSTDFGLARSELEGGAIEDESTTADLTLTYRRQITEDWDWRIGYRGRYRTDETDESRRSNAIITSFGRSFSIRP